MRLKLLLLGLLLLPFSHIRLKATCNLTDWLVEDASGKVQMICVGDTIDIVSPSGLSLWYKKRLTSNYEISYRIEVVMKNGEFDRLSDLNCFWAANDPQHPDKLFARSIWRNGVFANYNSLNLFYVGYGGNHNSTTRFRRYYGDFYGVDDARIKPLIKEYTDAPHLLKPNRWYYIQIRVQDNHTSFCIDGEELFRLPLEAGLGDGHFGLRLLQNHVRFTGFRVEYLK